MTTNQRHATWARTGTDVTTASNIVDAMKQANLDYIVEKSPIHLPSGQVIPNKYATVKQGTDNVLGIVGTGYTICQNLDAFDFVNYIEEDIKFVKAGQTGTGVVYVIARLPETYVLDDKIEPYVIFQNGHNGMLSVKAAIAPLRVVCQNQFNVAFSKSDNTVSIKHAPTLDRRLETAREVMKSTAGYMNTFKEEAEEWASISIKGKEHAIIDSFYDIDEDAGDRRIDIVEERRNSLVTAYLEDDNTNFRGTAWGMINAYSDVLTHMEPRRASDSWEEKQFTRVTFNPQLMQKFLTHIRKFQ